MALRMVIALAVLIMCCAMAAAGETELVMSNPEAIGLPAWPVTVCVPFPVGELHDTDALAVLGPTGRPIPAQFSVQTRWWARDRSVQTLQTSFTANPTVQGYRLTWGESAPRNPAPPVPVRVTREEAGVTLTNGPLRLQLVPGAPRMRAILDFDADGDESFSTDERVSDALELWQRPHDAGTAPEEMVVEEEGPVKAVILLRGRFGEDSGKDCLGYQLRLTLWAGIPAIGIDHTFIQDTGKVFIDVDEVSIDIRLPAEPKTARFQGLTAAGDRSFELSGDQSVRLLQVGPGRPQTIAGLDYEPFAQMSDERKQWRTPEEDGLWERDERIKEFAATWTADDAREVADKSTGWVTVQPEGRSWALSAGVRWFWQLHPKSVEITPEGLRLGLLPKLDRPHHIHLGAAKTHSILLALHESGQAEFAGSYQRAQDRPPMVFPTPGWMCASKVWGPIHPRTPGQFRQYERRVEEWCDNQFAAGVERNQLYGIWDFGDLLYSGGQWLNMETALDYGLFIQFIRTGDRKYFDYFERCIHHFRDVDVSHGDLTEGRFDYGLWIMPGYMPERLAKECARDDATGQQLRDELFYYLGDQPPPKGGVRRHSFNHYQNAGFSPARLDTAAEFKRGRLYGGTCTIGGHGWIIGEIAHYMLTGDRYSLETANLSGELILSSLRGLHEGRDNWKMIDVVHMYRVTGDPRYLEFAREAVDYHWARRGEITQRVDAQAESQLMSPYYTIGQFIRDYCDLTGDADATAKFVTMIREWLDAVEDTRQPTIGGPVFGYIRDFLDSRCHGDFADLAFSAEATGEREFIDRVLPDLRLYLEHSIHSTAFFELPRIMVTLDRLGIDPLDRSWEGQATGQSVARAWAKKAAGEPLIFWVALSSGYRVRSAQLKGSAQVTGPNGSVVRSVEIERGGLDLFPLTVPADLPEGIYKAEVKAPEQSIRIAGAEPLLTSAPVTTERTAEGVAARLVDGARLRYASAGNIDSEHGTLEVCITPLWEDTSKREKAVPYHYYHVFDSRDGEYDYGLSLFVYDGGEVNAGRSLIAAFADKDKASSVQVPCPWKAGELHRVAMTWEKTGDGTGNIALFVDGREVARQNEAPNFPSRPYRQEPEDVFVVGCNSTHSSNSPAQVLLHWLRISDTVRAEMASGQPDADEQTTFLLTFEGDEPMQPQVSKGRGEPR